MDHLKNFGMDSSGDLKLFYIIWNRNIKKRRINNDNIRIFMITNEAENSAMGTKHSFFGCAHVTTTLLKLYLSTK